ncbi:MAG: hypothetical protein H7338_17870 [Candidatus Sericytochromatia bacterium]|nr:hypothetical protein [Candidatus Sericytochromatia bacterium]
MPDPIRTSHQGLINLANRECGYRNVFFDRNDTRCWSNKGNLVIEHNNRGIPETCRNGQVISNEQRNNSNDRYQNQPYQRNDQYQPDYRHQTQPYRNQSNNFDATIPLIFLGGAILGAALSDRWSEAFLLNTGRPTGPPVLCLDLSMLPSGDMMRPPHQDHVGSKAGDAWQSAAQTDQWPRTSA